MGNSPSLSNKRIFSAESGLHSPCSVNSQFAGVSFPTKRQKKSFECEISLPNDILDISQSHPDLSEVTSLFEATSIHPDFPESDIFQADEDLTASVHQNKFFSVKQQGDNIESSDRYPIDSNYVSTVFRWNGGGKEIYISGSFNNWQGKVPMVKTSNGAWVIIECLPGRHEYKYFIDGAWYHDPTKPFTDNKFGTKNNVIDIQASDQDVLAALEKDMENSKHSNDEGSKTESRCSSPPGDYSQVIPSDPRNPNKMASNFTEVSKSHINPPILPPHLLQGLLNKSTNDHCDPNLLPQPNHVMLNHLYALSIKNGVIVLSVISRYRKKFVSTLFYKPIDGTRPQGESQKTPKAASEKMQCS